MNKRNCPRCDNNNAEVIMYFTPELLCAVNPTYRLEKLKEVLDGREKLLTYSRCKGCGMVYCENVWDNTVLNRVYKEVIIQEKSRDKTLKVRRRLGQVQNWRNVLNLLLITGKETLNSLKVVDYGCGWNDLLSVVDCQGVDVLGYDEYAAEGHIPIHRRNLYANSLEDIKSFGPVDVFFLISVLEHIQDVGKVMKMAKNLLKKDGILAIRVMDYRSGYIRKNVNRLEEGFPALSKNLNPIEHVNLYDYGSLLATLKRYGFELLSTGNIMRLADFALIPNGFKFIKYLNKFEKISSKIIKGKELMITAYARISDGSE